jgi:threonine/homoserine/homoserine lactone efflux protein
LWAGGIAGIAASALRGGKSSLPAIYWQGVITDLLNPKILLFFFPFLPQFVDPSIELQAKTPAKYIREFGIGRMKLAAHLVPDE